MSMTQLSYGAVQKVRAHRDAFDKFEMSASIYTEDANPASSYVWSLIKFGKYK